MCLIIGSTYTVLLANEVVVRFKFEGCEENGTVLIEIPHASGERVQLDSVFTPSNWLAYWLVAKAQR